MIRKLWIPAICLAFLSNGLMADERASDDFNALARSARWRHLDLRHDAPDDLELDLPHDAASLRFAELVFGTPESPRIAIVVARTGDDDFALYADIDRDRGIGESDLVKGTGSLRVLSIKSQQVIDNVVSEYPRQVLFRCSPDGSDLSITTVTAIDHSVTVREATEQKVFQTRQIDGDANGLFADSKDLLQIDINADGRFDPFLETFPFRPVVRIRGQRLFVKGDQFGRRLLFESATATGKVKVVAQPRSERDEILQTIVTLAGDDGSVYSITGSDAETELPVGRYAASVLFIVIKPSGTDRPWEFTFSRDRDVREQDWLNVTEAQTLEFDPIGNLTMDASVERNTRDGAANLSVQPQLFTGSGLLINLCHIEGSAAYSGPNCGVSLIDENGRSLVHSSSGFA